MLDQVANQLHDWGYRHMGAASLKSKHVERLVESWKAAGLSVGTIKNRMAELRWWAEKIGKEKIVAGDNAHYGIGNRAYVTNVKQGAGTDGSRSVEDQRSLYTDVAAASGGIWLYGVASRSKSDLKWADRGDKLVLKDT